MFLLTTSRGVAKISSWAPGNTNIEVVGTSSAIFVLKEILWTLIMEEETNNKFIFGIQDNNEVETKTWDRNKGAGFYMFSWDPSWQKNKASL